MIVGIGNDIVSVIEIKESIECSNRFLKRVFCLSEQEYCDQRSNKFQQYAGCFAVKEAIMKALGMGWSGGIQWSDIEVKHYPSGMPKVILYHHAKKHADAMHVKNIYISVSHVEQYASAIAILEK